MATPFDVAARLTEGLPAVDDVEAYVAACRRLGYQHPDLTADARQVHDWYASEEGLDLRALDADCAVLSTVAAAAEDAARMQNGLVAELAGAWSGRGAAAAGEFAWRSGQAATSVSVAIRVAADAATTLRDALWQAVDAKVAAVVAIDDRHQAQRAEWLAAATAVTSGAGDVAAASELVDQQVKPFVHNDIGTDWLGAMRAATASINGAYDASLAAMAAEPPAVFDVPGELGPHAVPSAPAAVTGSVDSPPSSVQTVPAAAAVSAPMPTASAGVSPWSSPAPAAPSSLADPGVPPPAALPTAPAAASMPAMGDLGAGTSSSGTGLSAFGQQLADLIGGLIGTTGGSDAVDADAIDDLGADDADIDGDDEDDDDDDDNADSEDEDDDPPDGEDPAAEEVETPEEPVEAAVDEPVPQPDPVPTPVPLTPPAEPVPPVVPEVAAEPGEPTPCEIAADELPQVGE